MSLYVRRIEEASLNAWPSLQHILFDGWILRFSKGYTKRANSVNPFFGSSIEVNQKIDVCERWYAEKRLPIVFRLTPFSQPADLDQVLEKCGYRKADLTLVLYCDLKGQVAQPALSFELREVALDDWLVLFRKFGGLSLEQHHIHKEILQTIPARRFLASLTDSGKAVACGLGVLEHNYFGLFDLVTDARHRNKGYGTQLVSGLLGWARDHGAVHAYLQVVSSNEAARHLYAKFGFQEVYQYWYRIAG